MRPVYPRGLPNHALICMSAFGNLTKGLWLRYLASNQPHNPMAPKCYLDQYVIQDDSGKDDIFLYIAKIDWKTYYYMSVSLKLQNMGMGQNQSDITNPTILSTLQVGARLTEALS